MQLRPKSPPSIALLTATSLALGACIAPATSDGPSESESAPLAAFTRELNVPGATLLTTNPADLEIDPGTPKGWSDHGLYLGHPKGQDSALWPADSQAFMPKLANLRPIVPVLDVQKGKTHVRRNRASGGGNSISDSTNWAGGVLSATTGAPFAAPGSALEGMTTSSQQHIHYVGADGHIHELYYTNQWIFNDLTVLAGAPAVPTTTALDTYVSTWNGQQHVNFVTSDGHIHELMFDTSWHHTDLTQSTGALAAIAGSRLDGYVSAWNNQQHVDYVGVDAHVHELVFGSAWRTADLFALSGAIVPVGGGLVGFTSSWNDQQHVNYVGSDGHVYELMFDSAWHHTDLTVAAGAPLTAPSTALDGYASAWNSQLHLDFIDTNEHVRELVCDSRWRTGDLTLASGSPAAARGTRLDGYVSSWNQQQHVNFVGADGHVRELMFDNAWHAYDFNASAGAPLPAVGASLDGYTTDWDRAQHVNFLGVDNHVHEVWFDTAWHDNDLTNAASLPFVTAVGSWRIPSISKPGEPDGSNGGWDSSSWVGIDGSGSNDVLQAGVDQFLGDDGTPKYVAWYEWFVQNDTSPFYVYQTNISNMDIHPGDDVFAVIRYANFTLGTITLANLTTNQSFAITLAPPANAAFLGNTIEWIMEANSHDNQLASIPAFSPVLFTDAYGTDVHGNAGNPASGGIWTIYLGGDPLTTTTLGNEQVTIDFLPWRGNDLTLLAKGGVPATGAIDAYATSSQQHVDYVGSDAHVHELVYDSAWRTTDLVLAASGAPPVAAGSHLDGYVSPWNGQQHVNYVGTDLHVHELMFDTAWHHTDLTRATGAPNALAGGALSAYVSPWNAQQHVNFVGADGHVHELMFGSAWGHTDVSLDAGAPLAVPGSALDGYASSWNDQLHMNFITADGHVHELMCDSTWHDTDLTKLTGDVAAQTTSALDAYTSAWNDQQHVNFIGADAHVHELVFDSAWRHGDLTAASGAPNALATSLTGYTSSWNSQQHVDFLDVSGNVRELMYDSSWHQLDLSTSSAGSGTPSEAPRTLVGFATPWAQEQHVDFVRTDGHIGELLY